MSKFSSSPSNYIVIEMNGYRLLLPEGTLDYFNIVDVKESGCEVIIYLEEKNVVPFQYHNKETESKGFYVPVAIQYFSLHGKKVFLNIRRRWLLKSDNNYISRGWRMLTADSRLTQDFASFLKASYQ